ncbi:mitoferrin-1-like isoform X3 [Cydia pomonella]|nr:mitoferrin-1-like isoform X3 [Cydia pomonella]XP_061723249.1 mitoferrin-1-like isoform X3 [Cydia pomonella]
MQSLRTAHNSSITETFRHMVRREGVLRPIRGMSAVVLGAGPAHACFFATYEHSKHTLGHLTRHRHDHLTHGLSGCLASLVHDAVSNPAEVVKQRLQMLNSPYRSVWECARRVYKAEGIRAFYRSYGTQVVMNVPFQSLHFVTYEWCQSLVNPSRKYDPRAHALSGACAGALAAAATTPLDVCKTVLNTQEVAARADGLAQAAALVLRATGPLGFFKGASARVLYQMPAAAICWLTYETLKHLLTTVSVHPGSRLLYQMPAARHRPARLLQGRLRQGAVPDARCGHLLAHLRDPQASADHGECPPWLQAPVPDACCAPPARSASSRAPPPGCCTRCPLRPSAGSPTRPSSIC